MRLQDIDYWVKNREYFFYPSELNPEMSKISDTFPTSSDELLKKLQYYFLAGWSESSLVEEEPDENGDVRDALEVIKDRLYKDIVTLTKRLLVEKNYGSKAKFLSGIVKRTAVKLDDKTFRLKLFEELLDEVKKDPVLTSYIPEYKTLIEDDEEPTLELTPEIVFDFAKDIFLALDATSPAEMFPLINLAYFGTLLFKNEVELYRDFIKVTTS